jgi:hypothetical protein
MPVFRLAATGGLYNPQEIKTNACMLSTTFGGAGSYKRTYNFLKYQVPQISNFYQLVGLVSSSFPVVI